MIKKFFFFLIFLLFVGLTAFAGWKFLPQAMSFSALEVVTEGTEADVYLDNTKIGKTPFENEKLRPGEHVLKLVPWDKDKKTWTKKIQLTTGAMTSVERIFGDSDSTSGGSVIYLEATGEPQGQINIITDPDEAVVYLNKEEKGKTPILLKNIPSGNQEILVKKDKFEDRLHRVEVTAGYKLTMIFDLVGEKKPIIVKPTVVEKEATTSGKIQTTPTTKAEILGDSESKRIEITDTETGWLRVREAPEISASESAKINVGEKFSVLEETTGWIKIEYKPGKTGWISSQYVKRI